MSMTPDERETMAQILLSQHNAILMLVKTLEEAGALQAKHYEDNLRMFSKLMRRKGQSTPAIMMEDLADILSRG